MGSRRASVAAHVLHREPRDRQDDGRAADGRDPALGSATSTKPSVVSVTRDDLVGQYVGHTAPKTKEVLKRAYGGVLFIDEAYYLYRPENERDYGQEAIEILLQVDGGRARRLVVVLAGYEDRMETFFRSNPGMGSRVAHHIDFPDLQRRRARRRSREMMLEERAYELTRGRERGAAGVRRAAHARAALRQRAQHPQRDRPRAAAPGEPPVRRRRTRSRADDLVTIEAEDILAQLGLRDEDGDRQPRRTDAMPRPIILGVVGDSAAGKTTITRGLVRLLGEQHVTHIAADDYHRYDRKQRAERGDHAAAPRLQLHRHHGAGPRARARGQPDPQARLPAQGRHLRAARLRRPAASSRWSRGCSATTRRRCATSTTCACSSPRRRSCGAQWKVQRDCSRRGYTTDQVLDGARPPRARLRGVHPPAAALGRHRRLVHGRRPRATRSTSTPS